MGNVGWSLWPEACHDLQHICHVSDFCLTSVMCFVFAFFDSWLARGLVNYVTLTVWFINHFRVLFNIMFGLSANYWMALTSRMLLGAFCGAIGPMRVRSHFDIRKPFDVIVCYPICILLRDATSNSRKLFTPSYVFLICAFLIHVKLLMISATNDQSETIFLLSLTRKRMCTA